MHSLGTSLCETETGVLVCLGLSVTVRSRAGAPLETGSRMARGPCPCGVCPNGRVWEATCGNNTTPLDDDDAADLHIAVAKRVGADVIQTIAGGAHRVRLARERL